MCCSTGSAARRSTRSSCNRWSRRGVEIRKFHKLRWYDIARINNRTHRKLLVVDGAVGFTGGVGIAPEWTGDAQDPDHWRDSHYKVEGPVVAQMQAVFMDNWIKASGEVLHGERYFPAIAVARRGRGADVQQLAVGRQREHAADVPAVHRRGQRGPSTSRAPTSCPTNSRATRSLPRPSAA